MFKSFGGHTFSLLEEHLHEIQRQGEDVGVVVLSRDGVEGLQVAELQGGRGLVHHVCCLSQFPGCTLFSLCRDHLDNITKKSTQTSSEIALY